MVKQGTGHIVNTASGAGLFPLPMSVAYTTSKYGVVGLSTALRPEAAGLGIKVSVVCPGAVRTNILDATVYLKINPEAARAQSESFKMLEPARCAQIILRGVTRNQAIIPVTTEAQIGWWLYRLSPTLYGLFGRKIADKFRKALRQD
jgi:short-subunit dehydrogenase